jgi:Na+/proline symporter
MAVYNITSLWDLFMTILGLISGGLAGIFLLGILTRRANGPGAFIGAIVSAILVFIVQTKTRMHFFLFGAVGVVSAMVVGYLVSLVIPARRQNLEGLTIYTLNEQKN